MGASVLIDQSAVKHNLAVVRHYAPDSKIMAVIKANAYGHGLLLMADLLHDIDAVAVARIEEGIQLRQAGFKPRILILEGFIYSKELALFTHYNLESVVYSLEQLELLERYSFHKLLVVWMKIDTGMNRLGFKPPLFKLAYQRLIQCQGVAKPLNFLTHFSSADDMDSEVTTQQITLFNQLLADCEGEKSMANSAGIMAWKPAITDWVRPGIMLYGISPFPNKPRLDLKPMMSLHAPLFSIKEIEAGETVGYTGTWQCLRKTRLGVIGIGYGDGYPRSAKLGTPVLINKQRVPLVGRVSMDMITVDLTDYPDISQGDIATLWGEGLPVEEIAECAETIPYTLLSGVTARVERKVIG